MTVQSQRSRFRPSLSGSRRPPAALEWTSSSRRVDSTSRGNIARPLSSLPAFGSLSSQDHRKSHIPTRHNKGQHGLFYSRRHTFLLCTYPEHRVERKPHFDAHRHRLLLCRKRIFPRVAVRDDLLVRLNLPYLRRNRDWICSPDQASLIRSMVDGHCVARSEQQSGGQDAPLRMHAWMVLLRSPLWPYPDTVTVSDVLQRSAEDEARAGCPQPLLGPLFRS